jgi:hypothetical protein
MVAGLDHNLPERTTMPPIFMLVFALVLVGASLLWVVDQLRNQVCGACRSKIPAGATICPHCRSRLAVSRAPVETEPEISTASLVRGAFLALVATGVTIVAIWLL